MQLRLNLRDKLLRSPSKLGCEHILVWLWFFQIGELTSEQPWIHEMTMSVPQMFANKRVIAAKKHQLHVLAHAKMFPIRSLQCRAGQDGVLICGNTSLDQFTQILQPRPPVVVRQRNATAHLLDIGR
jgi:hypothetical protein